MITENTPSETNSFEERLKAIEEIQRCEVKLEKAKEKVEELVRDCYAVCLPSYYPEGVPRFLLEGLSWGKPVITTANPGCKETINNRSNGFICQARNEEDHHRVFVRHDLLLSLEGRFQGLSASTGIGCQVNP